VGNLPAYSTKAFLPAPRERALRSTSAPPACDTLPWGVHARAQRGVATLCGAPRSQGWSSAALLVLGLDTRRRSSGTYLWRLALPVPTPTAILRCIGRIHRDERHTGTCCLVGHKGGELRSGCIHNALQDVLASARAAWWLAGSTRATPAVPPRHHGGTPGSDYIASVCFKLAVQLFRLSFGGLESVLHYLKHAGDYSLIHKGDKPLRPY
jgi:hypothetical protein